MNAARLSNALRTKAEGIEEPDVAELKKQNAELAEVVRGLRNSVKTLLPHLPRWARNTTVNVALIEAYVNRANSLVPPLYADAKSASPSTLNSQPSTAARAAAAS